jgi:hypothetical protein
MSIVPRDTLDSIDELKKIIENLMDTLEKQIFEILKEISYVPDNEILPILIKSRDIRNTIFNLRIQRDSLDVFHCGIN